MLNLQRDRETRQHADKLARDERIRDLLSFLAVWRSETERFNPKSTLEIWNHYSAKAKLFLGEAARVSRDFTDVREFNRLSTKMGGLRGPGYNRPKG